MIYGLEKIKEIRGGGGKERMNRRYHIVKADEFGRIEIPAYIREELDIREGTEFKVEKQYDSIRFTVMPSSNEIACDFTDFQIYLQRPDVTEELGGEEVRDEIVDLIDEVKKLIDNGKYGWRRNGYIQKKEDNNG